MVLDAEDNAAGNVEVLENKKVGTFVQYKARNKLNLSATVIKRKHWASL